MVPVASTKKITDLLEAYSGEKFIPWGHRVTYK
jgi:hypothetical protein